MNKTVCELFAGVGGFRCGLNNIPTLDDFNKKEKCNSFKTVQQKSRNFALFLLFPISALAWSAIVNFASTNLNLGFTRQFRVCSAHQSPLLPYCGLDAPVKYIQFYVRL